MEKNYNYANEYTQGEKQQLTMEDRLLLQEMCSH